MKRVLIVMLIILIYSVSLSGAGKNFMISISGNYLSNADSDYKERYGKYPDKLEDLVPEFIHKVPLARLCLAYNRFMYISRDRNPLLVYYVVPPFGRAVYDLEKKSWGYMD